MSSVLIEAVLKTGLLTPQQLAEMKRFRVPSLEAGAQTVAPVHLEEAAAMLAEVFQSEGFVMVRETDLNAIYQFVQDGKDGLLHLETEDGAEATIPVRYFLTPMGETVIPWQGESIVELLTSEGAYFLESGASSTAIRFSAVRELFFGAHKTFMVCTPR